MIAIHNIDSKFSERWIQYCEEKKISHILINIYDSNVIEYLKKKEVKFVFTQPVINDHKTYLIAKSIIYSMERAGIKTFPNYESIWHYEDKISQKYLLESLGIPHAPIHVFYDLKDTLNWLSNADYPLVFKLKGGAGSSNVKLIESKKVGYRLARKMFKRGFKPIRPVYNDFNTKISIHSQNKDLLATLRRLPTTIKNIIKTNQKIPVECGYFLIQEFLAGNNFDTRIVIVGNKAFAFRRFNRSNDFRASGSKNIDLNQENIDKKAIILSFEAARKIGSVSMAFDIIYNLKNEPVIIELSYTCPVETINKLDGYWDQNLNFHIDRIRLEDEIFDYTLKTALSV